MSVITLELPAAYLDPVILDTTGARLRLVNRVPEPAEAAVPVSSDVEVMLVDTDTGAPGVTLAATRVYVDGVLGYDGSLGSPFRPGWDGPSALVAAFGANAVRIVLGHVGTFTSSSTVTVRVVSAAGATSIDTSYTFTCADTSSPQVVGAMAVGAKRVRVSFNEPLRALGDGATSDARTAANYALAALSAPAVTPAVLSVVVVADSVLELVLDTELTPLVAYMLSVAGVADVSGNIVVAPYNSAGFTGFEPAKPDGRNFSLWLMVPRINRREDETRDLAKFIACLQEVLDLLLWQVDAWTDILDPDTAPEAAVDAMLADLGNPFAFDLSLTQKRLLLSVLVSIYKGKGVAPGIRNVVRFFLGLEITITAYTDVGMVLGESELGSDGTDGTWELGPSGSFARYAFNVVVPRVLTDTERSQIRTLVEYMKPSHTHFVELVEPTPAVVIDHVELGLSELGVSFDLHA